MKKTFSDLIHPTIKMKMAPSRAKIYVIAVLIFIAFVGGINALFIYVIKNWTIFGIVMGVIFGLTIGYFIIVKVPKKVQIAGVGVVTGMGIDWLASISKESGPQTAINSLATLISNVIVASKEAAAQAGLPSLPEKPISIGLWVFFIVLGLLMLFSSLEKEKED